VTHFVFVIKSDSVIFFFQAALNSSGQCCNLSSRERGNKGSD